MFPLQLLLLEANLLDAQKVQATVSSGGIDCQLLRVDTRADFVKALETNPFDLILSDYSLPGFDGRTALEIARQQRPETPFVFVSTSVGEELAIDALEAGAAGFVLKHRLERLVPCIKRVLGENSRYPSTEVALREEDEPNWAAVEQAGATLRDAEAHLHAVAANLPQGAVFVVDLDLRYLLAEGKALEAAGMTSKDLLGKTIWEALDPALTAKYEPLYRQALRGEPFQLEHYSHDRHYISHGTPLYNNQGEIYAVLAMSYDISDRIHAEDALRESEEKFRAFVSATSDIIYEMSADWRKIRSLEGKKFIATTEDPRCDWTEAYIPETDKPRVRAAIDHAIATRSNFELEHRVIRLDGTVGWTFSRAIPLIDEAGKIIKWFGAASDITNRVEVEAALRESEAKYRTLFESLDEGFCLLEVLFDSDETAYDYRFLEVNRAFEAQSGLADAAGKTILELVPNLELQWVERYGQVAKSGNAIRFEADMFSMNRFFDIYAYPSSASGKNVVAVLFTDISDRKRAEAQLRHVGEMDAFRVALSDTLRPLSNPIEIQTQACRLLGERLGVDRAYYVEVNEAEHYARVNQNYLRGDSPSLVGVFQLADYGWTLPLLQRSETIIVVDAENSDVIPEADRMAMAAVRIAAHISTPLVKAGTLMGVLCVTEYKSREWTETEIELVRETAERIWAAIERACAEEAVAADLRDTQLLQKLGARLVTEDDVQTLYQEILSTAIVLTRANAGTVQILDNATQELVLLATQGFNRTVFEHFYRVGVSCNTSCGIALRTGERSFTDFDVPASEDPDGSLQMLMEGGFLSAQSTPLITRSGRAIGMVSTHWHDHRRPSDRELRFLDLLVRQAADLIEQRQTEAEREKLLACEQTARAEADRANRVKDEFLAVLSHELRSPLNPILGWTHLLQSGKLDANRQREGLATIERNAKLQTQLIGDLLDISRIMQGKLSLTVDFVSLTFVITAAVETVRLAAEAKQIQILLDITAEIAPVSGDAARLQQVVWNLLTNAVKFTPNGGRVTVELRQIDQGAQIRVIDTGKGIEPQFLPHVFEYFRQADSTTTRQFGGLGLGLAIVQQIVERHGGTVKVESLGENQGATFTVQLPVIGQAVPTSSELSQAQAENLEASLNNLQILLVDDEADALEFQAFLLEQSGAKVVAVASSSEALQVLDQFIPDVLISDIGMAEMDGYMLIQHIRSRPPDRGGTIPAIALTAYARDFDQQKAFQSGFQAHITKPVEPDILIKTITRLLCSNNL